MSDRSSCGWLVLVTLANFAIRIFCGLAIFLVFVSAAGLFKMYFNEVDAELPAITQQILDLQNFVVGYWYLYVLLLPIDTLAFLFLASRSSTWRWLATVYSFLLPIASIGLLAIAFLAYALPFTRIVDKPPAAELPANQDV